MEPTFFNVIIFVVPLLAAVFFFVRRNNPEERIVDHKMYKNYRKSRMDKPVL